MFERNVPLRLYSNYKIGGEAKYFYRAEGLDNLIKAIKEAGAMKLPVFILGGSTNLLIGDEGFDGLVLKPEIKFLHAHDNLVHVGSGVLMADLLNFCIERGLSGLEWAGGLPGAVGGAVRGNAGAFGGEIKDSIQKVASIKIIEVEPRYIVRDKEECQFDYRHSIYKKNPGEIILGAVFNLKSGDPKIIREQTDEKINYRYRKHPMDYPNIGSIFKNVPWEIVPDQHKEMFKEKMKQDPFLVLPTAILIDRCGLRGVSYGGAMISPKHPNFIVNVMEAKADDVKELIKLVKEKVFEKFGIKLEEEVQYV
ncbi:MAG: UDP-N-acetylmuramate dehydrogenase [Patescibacteria group bacterium]